MFPLLQAADDNDIDINESTVVWVLLIILIVVVIVYIVDRMRRP